VRLFLQCGQSNAEVSLDFVSEKPGCLTSSLGGATLCYTFDQYRVISCIQKKSRVIVCQNSWKLVQASRRRGQSDVVASVLLGYPVYATSFVGCQSLGANAVLKL